MTQSHEHSPQGRVVALLSALALSLIGVAGVATPAVAADYGNVDNNKDGSIIIHKHVQAGTQAGTPDGSSSTITSAGLPDVVFKAYKLTDLNLSTKDGWDHLPTSVPPTACDAPSVASHTLGAGIVSPPTDGNGKTTISLTHPDAVGAYLVCETTPPATAVDKAQPFLVTIPYSYNESWLYNVNVYPKNGLAGITKTVGAQGTLGQGGLGLGSDASFPVTTDVPKIASNATFQYYWVQDAMDSRITAATVDSVKLASGAAVPGTYYTKSPAGTNPATVQFTSDGLTWLSTLGPEKIVTTFKGVVSTLGDGKISGTAYLGTKTAVAAVPTNPLSPPADPSTATGLVSSGKVTQNWGDLKLTKVDAGNRLIGLPGAKFQVWAAADPYAATCSTATTGSAVSLGGKVDFTTVAGGALDIAGLFVSDSANATKDALKRCYVLVETEAPAGFVTPPSTGDLNKTAVEVAIGAVNAEEITNTRISGLVLPMTGSNGIVALTMAGVALIAMGLLLAFLARRRKQTA